MQLLLGGGYAARILAVDDVHHALRQSQMLTLEELAFLNNIHRDTRVDIAENIEVEIDDLTNLNNVFFAHLFAFCVLDHGNSAVEFVETKNVVDFHAATGSDVIEHNAVFDLTDNHTFTSKSFRMSAMRIYLPLSTCLK